MELPLLVALLVWAVLLTFISHLCSMSGQVIWRSAIVIYMCQDTRTAVLFISVPSEDDHPTASAHVFTPSQSYVVVGLLASMYFYMYMRLGTPQGKT